MTRPKPLIRWDQPASAWHCTGAGLIGTGGSKEDAYQCWVHRLVQTVLLHKKTPRKAMSTVAKPSTKQ